MPGCCFPRAQPAPFLGEAGRHIIGDELLDIAIRATPQHASQLRVRFREWLQASGTPASLITDLVLAVDEALANVVEHAYPPGHPDPVLRLQVQLGLGQVRVTISDHGCWRIPHRPEYRGRGLRLMSFLATSFQLDPTDQGTTVHLGFPLHHGDADHSGPSRHRHE